MFLSPFFAAYRKPYNTHNVLMKMIEEWLENIDNSFL